MTTGRFLRPLPVSLYLSFFLFSILLASCTWRYSRELVAVGPNVGARMTVRSTGFELAFINIVEPDTTSELIDELRTEGHCTALHNIEIDYRNFIFFFFNLPRVTVSANCEAPPPAPEPPEFTPTPKLAPSAPPTPPPAAPATPSAPSAPPPAPEPSAPLTPPSPAPAPAPPTEPSPPSSTAPPSEAPEPAPSSPPESAPATPAPENNPQQ
jgi:hypothetical protein